MVEVLLDRHHIVRCRVTLRNHGATPALDVQVRYALDVGIARDQQSQSGALVSGRSFVIPSQGSLVLPVQGAADTLDQRIIAYLTAKRFVAFDLKLDLTWRDTFGIADEQTRLFSRLAQEWQIDRWYRLEDEAELFAALNNELARRVAIGQVPRDEDPRRRG